jgi:5-methylcytosine-specific restriction endonuclease McrA
LCEIREKCNGDATDEVDHIIPISEGGERFDEDNLQAACKRCHAWKTANIDRAHGGTR